MLALVVRSWLDRGVRGVVCSCSWFARVHGVCDRARGMCGVLVVFVRGRGVLVVFVRGRGVRGMLVVCSRSLCTWRARDLLVGCSCSWCTWCCVLVLVV